MQILPRPNGDGSRMEVVGNRGVVMLRKSGSLSDGSRKQKKTQRELADKDWSADDLEEFD